jgi:hypothetical protein
LIFQVKRRSCNIVSTLVPFGLAFACLFQCEGACSADETANQSQTYEIPAAPVVLLMTAAKQLRKKIWTKEINSVADVENALRNYIDNITNDCHTHKNYFTAETEHWLQKLLAPNDSLGKGKKGWRLASEKTLQQRSTLVRFAGVDAMQKIDNCMESIPPPVHSDNQRWFHRYGDWDPLPPSPSAPAPHQQSILRNVS